MTMLQFNTSVVPFDEVTITVAEDLDIGNILELRKTLDDLPFLDSLIKKGCSL